MARSPLKILENATLTFHLPMQTGEIDELGSPVSTTQDVVVKAFLKPSNRQSNNDQPNDGEVVRIPVYGYVTEVIGADESQAKFLPEQILPGSRADAVFAGKTGDFFLEPAIFPVELARQILGDKLAGYFAQRVQFGDRS